MQMSKKNHTWQVIFIPVRQTLAYMSCAADKPRQNIRGADYQPPSLERDMHVISSNRT